MMLQRFTIYDLRFAPYPFTAPNVRPRTM